MGIVNAQMENMEAKKVKMTEKFKQFRDEFQLKDKSWRMYVKPFCKSVVEDLERLKNSAYAAERIRIVEKDGTYEITSQQPIMTMDDYVETLWGMLHRMYERQSSELASASADVMSNVGYKRALKWHENDLGIPVSEEDRDKNFYIVMISPEFIGAKTLPRFRTAA